MIEKNQLENWSKICARIMCLIGAYGWMPIRVSGLSDILCGRLWVMGAYQKLIRVSCVLMGECIDLIRNYKSKSSENKQWTSVMHWNDCGLCIRTLKMTPVDTFRSVGL